MQFTTREDIEAPIDFVFANIVDFDKFERAAMRRGVEIERRGATPAETHWTGKLVFRGKTRNFQAHVVSFERPEGIVIDGNTDGFLIKVEAELMALTPTRTRVRVALNLSPRGLSARLILQSVRLAKQNLTKRYKRRVHVFAQDIARTYEARETV